MQRLLLDLAYAGRQLRQHPRFAAVAMLTLALGIGANTAIFSALNRLILDPLPYPHARRLVFPMLQWPKTSIIAAPPPRPVARAWRDDARSLDGLEAYVRHDGLVSNHASTRLVHYMAITPGLPAFLGVRPLRGRTFNQYDADPAAPAVALLSAGLWQRRYGGGKVLGHSITVDGVSRTIVGVLPPGWDAFTGRRGSIDLWVPLSLAPPPDTTSGRPASFVQVIARLRPGTAATGAQSELDAIAKRAWPQAHFGPPNFTTRVRSPSQQLVGRRTRSALLLLFAAVGLVLLVACANVANLLLSRGAARAPEFALRTVLGAGRGRLVRQLVTESLLLALLAGAVGAVLGWAGLRLIARLRPDLDALHSAVPDTSVLAFTVAVSVTTGVLFGIVPALQLSASSPRRWLQQHRAGTLRGSSGRLGRALVAGEIAICVVLLVGAGLLVRSLVHLEHMDLGFDARHLFTVQLTLPQSPYRNTADRNAFTRQLLARIREMPGTSGAAQALDGPGEFTILTGALKVELRGQASPKGSAPADYAENYVQPDYFHVLRMRMLAGRTFSAEERHRGRPTALIVNQAMARRIWGNEQAVGQQLRSGPKTPWVTVVGVVADAVVGRLTMDRHRPELFWPYASKPDTMRPLRVSVIVRSTSDPSPIIAAIRRAVSSLDSKVAVSNVILTQAALASSLAAPRFDMTLFMAFAVVALILASVGVAAIVHQAVSERMHEIGIRMALGAAESKILRSVLGEGALVCGTGIAVGVVGALAATGLMSGMLYGTAPRDPLTFVGVVALLAGIALLFTWLGARRATRVDPVVALRAE